MGSLLQFLSGSMGSINQLYFLEDGQHLDKFVDIRTPHSAAQTSVRTKYSFFIKDDWKMAGTSR
jgi:hypothetical protein